MKPVARTALVMTLVFAPIALAACQASSPGPTTIVFQPSGARRRRDDRRGVRSAVKTMDHPNGRAAAIRQPATPLGAPR